MNKYRLTHYRSPSKNRGMDYDYVIDMTIRRFNLNSKSRKQYLRDQVHYLLIYWSKHKYKTKKYKTLKNIGEALNLDHSSIVPYVSTENRKRIRAKSRDWAINIGDISEYIKDCSCAKMRLLNNN